MSPVGIMIYREPDTGGEVHILSCETSVAVAYYPKTALRYSKIRQERKGVHYGVISIFLKLYYGAVGFSRNSTTDRNTSADGTAGLRQKIFFASVGSTLVAVNCFITYGLPVLQIT